MSEARLLLSRSADAARRRGAPRQSSHRSQGIRISFETPRIYICLRRISFTQTSCPISFSYNSDPALATFRTLQTPVLVLAPGRILITRASAMFQGQLRRDSAAKLCAFMSPPLTVKQISFPLTLSRKCRPVASQLTTWPEAIHPAEQEESWD